MLGRTPGTIQAIRPLKDGVIADFDVTEEMLRHFIQRVHQNRFAHPRVVVCVPSGVTGVEKRAVEEACLSAGARQAYLIEEPMAAAIGAGLPVGEPTGSMVLDVGGGTSEVAVISLGGIVVSESIRVGGDEMDDAIVNHCKHQHKLLIGQQTAEEVKLEIGSAAPLPRGGDDRDPRPRHGHRPAEDDHAHLRARSARALEEPVSQIVGAVKDTLDRTPPELAGDIMDRGITLAGGGALLQGMDQRIREECQMPAQLTESPLTCVAVGSGRSLEEFEVIHRMSRNSHRRGLVSVRVGARVPQAGTKAPRGPGAADRRVAGAAVDPVLGAPTAARCTRCSAASRRCFGPLEEGASRALKPARDLINWFDETFKARGENARPARPRSQQLRDQARQVRRAAEGENQQLRKLLGLDRAGTLAGYTPVTARVIGRSPTVWYSTVTDRHGLRRRRRRSTTRWSPATGWSAGSPTSPTAPPR